MKKYFLTIPFFLLAAFSQAAVPSYIYGPNNPGTAANGSGAGVIQWVASTQCFVSDNVYATALVQAFGDDKPTSNTLNATNFNFALNNNFTILGIMVEIEKKADAGSPGVTDLSVKLIKHGVISGSEHKAAADWPTTDTYSTYGSKTDLWGTTWSFIDINGSDFGVAISAQNTNPSFALTAYIDYIRITVYSLSTVIY